MNGRSPDEVTGTGPASSLGDVGQTRLAVALQAAQLGLWEWEPATGAILWDARSTAIFGFQGRTVTGTIADVDAAVDPRDRERLSRVLQESVATAGSVEVEFRTRWPDGSEHWVNARGQALVDTDGHVVRLLGTNADVTEARAAAHQQVLDAAAMAGLVAVATDLGEAHTESAVLQVVTDRGTPLLGAQAMGLALLDHDRPGVRTLATAFDAEFLADVAHLPPSVRLPLVDTSTTGRSHFLPDLAATVPEFPDAAHIYARTGTEASASVALHGAGGTVVGALSVAFAEPHEWREAEERLLVAFAALTSQALQRLAARAAEAAAGALAARFTETLQKTLLTWTPPAQDDLQVAVRYVPSSHHTRVGGDWYDVFTTAGGELNLVIGDVTGHDQQAAAAMAQLRNLLRGIAHATDAGPAAVLTALDRAVADLRVGVLATLVVAQVRSESGTVRMRWSNAGHPPPLLLAPDGAARYLDAESNLLLGLEPATVRFEHEVVLAAGSSVVLTTDGLVERRGVHLQRGLDWLAQATADLARERVGPVADHLCDGLLALTGEDLEDDVALLALHVAADPSGVTA
ncbi:SpoIIE family protein phosphatase [Kineococcus sp. NPDC059986]|uniref:SpoIIE family protein phosphatase n=1 Tax=Kineococcus sp. NPDC059986 TaxID=3155538 RepID=UPI00344CFE90